MLRKILFTLLVSVFLMLHTSCSKHEQENSATALVLKNTQEKDVVKNMQKAILDGNAVVLLNLIDKNSFDVNQVIDDSKMGTTLLNLSLESQKYHIAEALMKKGADASIKNNENLSSFDLFENNSLALKILNNEAIDEIELLNILISDGIDLIRISVIDWVLSKDVDINQKVGRKPPPIIYAANKKIKEAEMLKLFSALLKFKNIDLDIKFRKKTALDLIQKKKYSKVEELLLNFGAK